MARQATGTVGYNRSSRVDEGVLMTSGRAGIVVPALWVPVLREDSVSGQVSITLDLGQMPKPLLNAVFANVQAWYVPKSAFPQFAGTDEFLNSYMGTSIRALGSADRAPPPFYIATSNAVATGSDFLKTLGIHVPTGETINIDLIDAFNLIYNFRLAAHSSKLPLKKYFQEVPAEAVALPPAFWPSGRFSAVVADYEKALLIGALDLDVSAGEIPLRGFWRGSLAPANAAEVYTQLYDPSQPPPSDNTMTTARTLYIDQADTGKRIWADMMGTTVNTSLADIDKARTTQAFAKLRTAYAGNDSTGFMNDDMLLAHLMQGISVPPEYFRRPWLLGQRRVPFGFAERHATDGESLDQSVTEGRTMVELPINVPQNSVGGYICVTVEVLPERLDERQTDMAVLLTTVEELPNALRDVQRKEPVDDVLNVRIDAKHTAPTLRYGYEPMNNVWNRSFTRLGGVFFAPNPAAPVTESRAGIWQAGVIDPVYNEDHFLAPVPFPHTVFADTTAPAFEMSVRHSLTIIGNTQIGDVLAENNDDYAAIVGGGIDPSFFDDLEGSDDDGEV